MVLKYYIDKRLAVCWSNCEGHGVDFAEIAPLLLPLTRLLSHTPPPAPERVLAGGDTITAYRHDSISRAPATMERLGRESGAFDTTQPVPAPARNTRDLNYFDAIFFFGTGDNLRQQQKKDLLSFIHNDGKGFVGAHTGDDFDAPVIVEEPAFPAMKPFPLRFSARTSTASRCACWPASILPS